MDRSYPYSRRLVSRARLHKRLAVVTAAGLVGATTLFMLAWKPDPITAALPAAPLPALADHAGASPAPAPGMRRIYPYSVVPGGVSGQAELKRVIRTDRVVAAHYASFDVDKARPSVVERPRAVHVSYRKGDKVYWTARKVMLAEGETLLTDGRNEMRARCANRISDVPQYPVEAHQPAMEELDQPVDVDGGEQFAMGPDGLPVSMREHGGIGRHTGRGFPLRGGSGGGAPGATPGNATLAGSSHSSGAPAPAMLTAMGLSGSSSSMGSRPRPTPAPGAASGTDGSGSSSAAPATEDPALLPAVEPLPDAGTPLAPTADTPPSGSGPAPQPGTPGATPLPGTTPAPGADPLPGSSLETAPLPGGQQSGGGQTEQPLPPTGSGPPVPTPTTGTKPFIPEPDLAPLPSQPDIGETAPPSQVPEPGSPWLLAPALLALAAVRARRRR